MIQGGQKRYENGTNPRICLLSEPIVQRGNDSYLAHSDQLNDKNVHVQIMMFVCICIHLIATAMRHVHININLTHWQ